uniref:Kinase n=2 Tax=Petromyzon marinus TaxID=7757 RepID=A0AAJ7X2K7_PETMA|nr:inositol-trisphosphate 3-kinase A-like isoform X1 [Petromyzon marinus]
MMPGMVATGLARVSDSIRGLQLSSGLSSSSSAASSASSSVSSSVSSAATSTVAAVSASSSTAAEASARLPSAGAPPPSSTVAVSTYSISLASSTTSSSSAHAHNDQVGCTLSRSGDRERPDSGKIAADDGDGGGDGGDGDDEKETAAANEHAAATRHSDSHTGGPCRPKRPPPAPTSAPQNAVPRSASWVQLSGHEGSLMPSHSGTVLKRFCPHEQRCLQLLMGDAPLCPFVPEFHGDTTITTVTATVIAAGAAVKTTAATPSRYRSTSQRYNRMQDLLAGFRAPAAMDCKMGVRTYLEEELALARRDPQPRADMLAKMVAVDPTAPTALERERGAVTKPRYMQWRELCSSSASLGFRIEATKKSDGTLRQDFKRTKSRDEVRAALEEFVGGDAVVMESYIRRLHALRAALEVSPFFRSHEVIGSSLLFVHDAGGPAGVWMIDFSKTRPLPPGTALDHRTAWREGNREDGYLGGLDNLVAILEDVAAAAAAEPRSRRRC